MNIISHHIQQNERVYSIAMVIFFAIELIGLYVDVAVFRNYIQYLFFISVIIFSFSYRDVTPSFIRFALIVLMSSFGLQMVAVTSESIFGNFEYGDSLGTTIKDIPAMSSILWLLIIFSSAQMSSKIIAREDDFLRSFLGGFLVLVIYFLIEQTSAYFHIWYRIGDVPMSSYLAWFVIGFFYNLLYHTLGIHQPNKIATALYISFLLLFLIPSISIR